MKILVTGGASGLGQAITRKLASDGKNTIFFTFNSSKQNAEDIERKFSNTKAIFVDFSSEESLNNLLALIEIEKPDVLINNALSKFRKTHFHKLPISSFKEYFILNIAPVLAITSKFISESRKRKSGKIITILTAGLVNKPPVGLSEYVASKAYLHSMVKAWAVENAAFGITSNGVSPSFMLTGLTKETDTRIIENMVNDHPNKKLLETEEVADVVSFLISATPQINGTNLVINSGQDII